MGAGFCKGRGHIYCGSQTLCAPECVTERLSIDSQCQTLCQGKVGVSVGSWGEGGTQVPPAF